MVYYYYDLHCLIVHSCLQDACHTCAPWWCNQLYKRFESKSSGLCCILMNSQAEAGPLVVRYLDPSLIGPVAILYSRVLSLITGFCCCCFFLLLILSLFCGPGPCSLISQHLNSSISSSFLHDCSFSLKSTLQMLRMKYSFNLCSLPPSLSL